MTAYQQLQTRLPAQPRTWLITGVAGFIGSNLLETLLKLNQRVVGLDNFATGHQRNLNEVQTLVSPAQWANFSFIKGDIRSLADCQQAMTWSPVRHAEPSAETSRHCEQSAAIHAPASSTMDRHGLRPRDDEKDTVIASEAWQSISPTPSEMDRHGLRPRDDEKDTVIASEARQSMPPAPIPVDYVLHQAALGSVPRSLEDPVTTNSANITGFLNMLVAARDAKVKSFTYAASSSTYGDHPALPKVEDAIGKPLSPYAVTKYVNELYAEVFARSYGFNTVGLRYFNVFGPRQDPNGAYAAVIPKWTAALLQGEPVYINGDGETSRDFCFIANAVQANLLAATAESVMASSDSVIASEARQSMPPVQSPVNQVYNVAVGDRTTLNILFALLRDNLAASGVSADTQPVYRDFRAGDVRHSQADIGKAQRLLGYAPTHSIGQGVQAALGWYVKNQIKPTNQYATQTANAM